MFIIAEMSQTADKLGCLALGPFSTFDIIAVVFFYTIYMH